MAQLRLEGRLLLLVTMLLLCTACGKVSTYTVETIPQNVRPHIYVQNMSRDPVGMEAKLTTLLIRNGYQVLSAPNTNVNGPLYVLSYTYNAKQYVFGNVDIFGFTAKLHDARTGRTLSTFILDSGTREGVLLDNFIAEFIKVVPR